MSWRSARPRGVACHPGMGAGGSSGGGTSLSGGRTALAGTFLAEKTHSNPPKYTLVSVSAALHGEAGPPSAASRVGQGGVRGTPRGARRTHPVRAEKCTILPALSAIEPLLSPDEAPSAGCSSAVACTGAVAAGTGEAVKARADGLFGTAVAAPRREPAFGSRLGSPARQLESQGGRSDASEVFGRLAAGGRQPWVATRTDSQLLTYLAHRGGDPTVAVPPSIQSCGLPPELRQSTVSSASSRPEHRHRNHRELFDRCLRRELGDPLTGGTSQIHPPPCAAPRRTRSSARKPGGAKANPLRPCDLQARGGAGLRLTDMLEEIAVLPEDAVASFFATKGPKRVGGVVAGLGPPAQQTLLAPVP